MKDDMKLSRSSMQSVLTILSVFAPHAACELLERLLQKELTQCTWPSYDASLLVENDAVYAIQVNGKLRATITMSKQATADQVQAAAQQAITKWLEGKNLVKVIFIAGKTINFVVKDF